MNTKEFFPRDVSWVKFNERVLLEAAREDIPLMERIRFLSIYSSNLDEFYRVRFPTLLALDKIEETEKSGESKGAIADTLDTINNLIREQLNRYGKILTSQLLPALRFHNIFLLYGDEMPDEITEPLRQYFLT